MPHKHNNKDLNHLCCCWLIRVFIFAMGWYVLQQENFVGPVPQPAVSTWLLSTGQPPHEEWPSGLVSSWFEDSFVSFMFVSCCFSVCRSHFICPSVHPPTTPLSPSLCVTASCKFLILNMIVWLMFLLFFERSQSVCEFNFLFSLACLQEWWPHPH